MFYHLFTLAAMLTNKELAGRIANSIPRKRFIVWIHDATTYWLSDNFDYCRLCFEFVIGEDDPQAHATCLADYRREAEEDQRLDEDLAALEDERVRDEREEQVWQAHLDYLATEVAREVSEAVDDSDYDTRCPGCGNESCQGDCEEPVECPGGCGEAEHNCVCAELASLKRYNATPLEERCGPWTA